MTSSRTRSWLSRFASALLVIGFLLMLGMANWGGNTQLIPGVAQAALQCTNDTAGANDEPGLKDLTRLCIDSAGLPTSLSVSWSWDEISVSGANTLDACSLYDTDADRNVNFALCVTDPTDGPIVTTLYTCGDTSPDRCSQPLTSVPIFSSTCSTSTQNTDPFSAGASFPQDQVASCTVVLADVDASSATLLDVCSYPAREPNSDTSDCVILQNTPPTATLTPTSTSPPTNTPTSTAAPTNTPTSTAAPTNTPTNTATTTATSTPTATGRVGLCHATGAVRNPYVFLRVDADDVGAHLAHGDFLASGPATCPRG
jgi:hypothetical protein